MVSLTLLESAKLAAANGEVKKAAVIQTFRSESDLLANMQILTVAGSAYSYNVEQVLPGIAFRGVNDGYAASAGVIQNETEPLKIAGGTLDVDRALIKMHGAGIRNVHEQMKTKALARQVSYTLVEGNASTSPKEVDGLKRRVPTTGSQALALASAAPMSMKAFDELKEMVDNPTHFLMNKAQARNINAFLRSAGSGAASVEMTKDEFGRPLMSYAGLPILIADRNGDLATLPFTEASSTSSVFVLSIGLDSYHLIQNSDLEVIDVGQLPVTTTATNVQTLVEWLVSQAIVHPRGVARGHNFTNATAVA